MQSGAFKATLDLIPESSEGVGDHGMSSDAACIHMLTCSQASLAMARQADLHGHLLDLAVIFCGHTRLHTLLLFQGLLCSADCLGTTSFLASLPD